MSERTGVLLVNLGSPAAPTAAAVRRYLRQFLSDRRVVEAPRAVWLPILHGIILPFRSPVSARKYARIWSPAYGSPLTHFTRRLADLAGQALGPGFVVEPAMRYGEPGLRGAIDGLLARGVRRLVALPLYPQYSATTTASVLDELFRVLLARREVPAVHVVPPYHRDPAYLEAVAARVRDTRAALPAPPDHVLISFHGLPVAMDRKGDPYRGQCEETAAALARSLGLAAADHTLVFQSRFGPARWLEPATLDRLRELARGGARRVLVVTPGFAADCLETLDELGNEAAHFFREAGGESLALVPCLNDSPAWVDTVAKLVRRAAGAWA